LAAAEAEQPVEPVEKDPLASTEEEDPLLNMKPLNFTELHRLHYTVLAIENDCHLMPKGAVMMTPEHEMRRCVAFRGLRSEFAFNIENYCHFRSVQNERKRNLLMYEDAVINRNLLDEACDAKIKGAWSVVQGSNKTAVIRNHEWPGYTVFHRASTRVHGAVYMGDGLKNLELSF